MSQMIMILYEGKARDFSPTILPDFSQPVYERLLGQVQKVIANLNKLCPNFLHPLLLTVKSEPRRAYEDDGNTPAPGTVIDFYWQVPLGCSNDSFVMADNWFAFHNGNATKGLWFTAEYAYRNRDFNVYSNHNAASLRVARWDSELREHHNLDRPYYRSSGDFSLSAVEYADTVQLIRAVAARMGVEAEVAAATKSQVTY